MRKSAMLLLTALGLAAPLAPTIAAPRAPVVAPAGIANIVLVAGGCGAGFHRGYRGRCVRNRHYVYRRYYGPPYAYGYAYQPWNRPSPGDYVANQLNAQELRRGYWGY
jgi:hypothetical protein